MAMATSATSTSSDKPRVLLVSLRYQAYFDDIYAAFLGQLSDRAQVQRVKSAGPVLRMLAAQPPPAAVVCTDEAITLREFAHIYDALLTYMREAGGTCVLMGHFPNFVKPLDITPFFAKAGLPWEHSNYHRTTLVLNEEAVQGTRGLLSAYSQKAVYVKNVATSDAWYVTSPDSVTESHVLATESAHTVGETSVALARLGAGKLGYVGDVNGEAGSDAVILAMCGL